MPHIIAKPRNTTETLFQIKYQKKNFKLSAYESDEGIRFFLGGHSNIYCLEGFIYKDISPIKEIYDISVGLLIQVYYDSACSLDGNFEKSIDTKNIIHLFLAIIKKNFKHVQKIKLMDASFKECNNGSKVSLSNMLFVRRGLTWYQQHFKAYIDPDYLKKYDDAVKRFNESKSKMPWEVFVTYIRGSLPLKESDMKIRYETSSSWQHFFDGIAIKIGDSKFCEFVSPWLDAFMALKMQFDFGMAPYLIDLQLYSPITEYEIKPFRHVGGHRRRKYTLKKGRLEKLENKSVLE